MSDEQPGGRHALEHAVAKAAAQVPGVAFLRPGIADYLRGAARPRVLGRHGGPPAGVRVARRERTGRWEVHVQVVVRGGHRAVDVARAVRAAASEAVAAAADAPPALHVKVTVAGSV
jgi:uncharacterized alkaline shock family protein YloU